MLTLNDGRAELWQWDTGRTLAVDADCSQVHFSNKVFGRSIDVDVVDGTAIIPDILLQTDKELNVWAFVGTAENGYTKISKTFKVNRRNKPADYVFTPAEQMTLNIIQRQIGDLSDLTTEAKDTLVAAINEAARTGGGAGSMDLRVADGYIQYSRDGGMTWTNLIAMADLKGDPGEPGKDGHSPVVTATKSGKTTTISVDGAAIATVEDGADGKPGTDGADGVTPHIGSNGNWYLGETDTGKPSRGADGATGATGATGEKGADGKSAYQYAQDGGYAGTETEFAAKLAQEIPAALPNPNALTFTGAVTGTYDGSAPLEVEIPSGGGGGGGGGDVFELIGEATSSGVSDIAGLTIPFDGSLYKAIIAYAYNLPAGNKKRIIIRKTKTWYDGSPLGWNSVDDIFLPSMTNMINTWGFFGVAIDVGGKLFTLGAAEANNNSGHGYFRFWPQRGALPTLSLSDCKFISLDCNSNSEKIPDGCSLIVWGVRK